MKAVLKTSVLFFALFVSVSVKAHNPDLSSTLLIEQAENEWVLLIRAALTGFEYEIDNRFGLNAYASPEEFQELVIKHITENTTVLFNDGNLDLQDGMVKLGHETSVTFKLKGAPENLETINITNSSFANIGRNQSALIVIKEQFSKEQFVLNAANKHTVQLKVGETKFELITANQEKFQMTYYLLAAAVIILLLSAFFVALKKNQNSSETSSLQSA